MVEVKSIASSLATQQAEAAAEKLKREQEAAAEAARVLRVQEMKEMRDANAEIMKNLGEQLAQGQQQAMESMMSMCGATPRAAVPPCRPVWRKTAALSPPPPPRRPAALATAPEGVRQTLERPP